MNRRGKLGDYGPNPSTGTYDESEVFGCQPGADEGAAAYGVDAGSLGMLQNSPGDAPGFDEIVWSSRFYAGQSALADIVIAADPARVIVIVEKVDAGPGPVAINFGSQASAFSTVPGGLQLYTQGSVLYIDTYCPTNDLHIALNSVVASVGTFAQCSVVIGTRGRPKQPLPIFYGNEA